MSNKYIYRDYINTLPKEKKVVVKIEPMKEKKIKPVKKNEIGSLTQILFIGPKQIHKCHTTENLYDCAVAKGFDVRYLCPDDLNLTDKQKARTSEYYLSNIQKLLGEWKPQMIFIDDCWVLFRNTLAIPVFYNHMAYMRPPMVNHPTVLYLYHEDILKYYEHFYTDWMAQIAHKKVLYVAYNPSVWKPMDKEYTGINAFGGREGFQGSYKINEIMVMAEVRILEQEHKKYKKLGLNYFEGQWDDNTYRKMMPKCEALWVNLSTRQITSRSMLECMATKTLCMIKTQEEKGNFRIEEILAKMDLIKGEHYIGVDKISDLPKAFNETTNKKEIIKRAYNAVSKKHTYTNRMEEIVQMYNEIMETKRKK